MLFVAILGAAAGLIMLYLIRKRKYSSKKPMESGQEMQDAFSNSNGIKPSNVVVGEFLQEIPIESIKVTQTKKRIQYLFATG